MLVAEDYEATAPPASYTPHRPDRGVGAPTAPELALHRRILVLGWSHHVPDMLAELDSYTSERFELVVASMVPQDVRRRHLDNHEIVLERIAVDHVELDYTVPGQLRRCDPAAFDNIVLVANDWVESEEADARTILGHLLLREILPEGGGPEVLVELAEPGNLGLFRRGTSEVITPPTILSHIMAQVALRRELRVVFEDLFGPEGSGDLLPQDRGLRARGPRGRLRGDPARGRRAQRDRAGHSAVEPHPGRRRRGADQPAARSQVGAACTRRAGGAGHLRELTRRSCGPWVAPAPARDGSARPSRHCSIVRSRITAACEPRRAASRYCRAAARERPSPRSASPSRRRAVADAGSRRTCWAASCRAVR